MKTVTPREAFDRFKPESCVFVISVDRGGRPSGMIAGWNMKCSYDPPLFAVALSKTGYTHRLIRESGEFVIAVPNKGLQSAVEFFGSTHGDQVDKFKETGLATLPARHIQSPLIRDATINFECVLEKEVDSGDHIIFIGRILEAYVNEGKKVLLNMKKVDGRRIFEEF
ncbi:MAG: flavin reductase family protein [Calditrichaeota bacterium]|nr:flavin reductase family protein [Calditrichota bacterium]